MLDPLISKTKTNAHKICQGDDTLFLILIVIIIIAIIESQYIPLVYEYSAYITMIMMN